MPSHLGRPASARAATRATHPHRPASRAVRRDAARARRPARGTRADVPLVRAQGGEVADRVAHQRGVERRQRQRVAAPAGRIRHRQQRFVEQAVSDVVIAPPPRPPAGRGDRRSSPVARARCGGAASRPRHPPGRRACARPRRRAPSTAARPTAARLRGGVDSRRGQHDEPVVRSEPGGEAVLERGVPCLAESVVAAQHAVGRLLSLRDPIPFEPLAVRAPSLRSSLDIDSISASIASRCSECSTSTRFIAGMRHTGSRPISRRVASRIERYGRRLRHAPFEPATQPVRRMPPARRGARNGVRPPSGTSTGARLREPARPHSRPPSGLGRVWAAHQAVGAAHRRSALGEEHVGVDVQRLLERLRTDDAAVARRPRPPAAASMARRGRAGGDPRARRARGAASRCPRRGTGTARPRPRARSARAAPPPRRRLGVAHDQHLGAGAPGVSAPHGRSMRAHRATPPWSSRRRARACARRSSARLPPACPSTAADREPAGAVEPQRLGAGSASAGRLLRHQEVDAAPRRRLQCCRRAAPAYPPAPTRAPEQLSQQAAHVRVLSARAIVDDEQVAHEQRPAQVRALDAQRPQQRPPAQFDGRRGRRRSSASGCSHAQPRSARVLSSASSSGSGTPARHPPAPWVRQVRGRPVEHTLAPRARPAAPDRPTAAPRTPRA